MPYTVFENVKEICKFPVVRKCTWNLKFPRSFYGLEIPDFFQCMFSEIWPRNCLPYSTKGSRDKTFVVPYSTKLWREKTLVDLIMWNNWQIKFWRLLEWWFWNPRVYRIWWIKLWQFTGNLPNPSKFSPTKVLCCTVFAVFLEPQMSFSEFQNI